MIRNIGLQRYTYYFTLEYYTETGHWLLIRLLWLGSVFELLHWLSSWIPLWLIVYEIILYQENRWTAFNNMWSNKYSGVPPTLEFLFWLVGAVEGSLLHNAALTLIPFRLSKKLTPENVEIIYTIKNNLGFGNVNEKKNNGTVEFVSAKLWVVVLIYNLLNGNLVSDHRTSVLKSSLALFNVILVIKGWVALSFISTYLTLSWANAWLAGYLNIKACFKASFDNGRLVISVIINEKHGLGLLEKITALFVDQKIVRFNTAGTNVYENQLVITGDKNLKQLIDYLENSPFYGSKNESFIRFAKIFKLKSKLNPKEHIEYYLDLIRAINRHDS